MNLDRKYDLHFTYSTIIEAEGARVGIVNCRTCGAAILLDPRDKENFAQVHLDWHKKESSKNA